jgi:hypothetical protein
VSNVDVIEENVALHGPDLESNRTHCLEIAGVLVLIVVGVLDLFWSSKISHKSA